MGREGGGGVVKAVEGGLRETASASDLGGVRSESRVISFYIMGYSDHPTYLAAERIQTDT